MALRGGLHEELCRILASFGVWLWDPFRSPTESIPEAIEQEARRHVYFQPPQNFKMEYPCIVYRFAGFDTKHAGNKPYTLTKRYTVTVIDKDPDSAIPERVAMLPACRHDRGFVSDSLYHNVFTIIY